MLRRLLLLCALLAVLPLLVSFRLQPATAGHEALLYDVRAAFVAARSDVPAVLVTETDRLVNEAILSTIRQRVLPRTILTIRIDRLVSRPTILGGKRAATVSVEAVAVGNGEVIAEGSFDLSVFSLRRDAVDLLLAERIAARIASEFRLAGEPRSTLAIALFPGR
ncbi:hypothetical protein ABID21_003513 [Pseudorhizobium tarimense]|uniref:Uncharacterized protein n=1 Tax=Pseudorhizobium tarimense TaxID=1079109 RepID=A0ABV2HA01_9HYPH|nr:hypothetical protein [Pseudorhizobium tarimense]MCJ8520603.1 hypothetical protein [Pseudorhizobium tarimense]